MMKTIDQDHYSVRPSKPPTNIRRSRLEIQLDILDTVSLGNEKPTRIMNASNIPWLTLQKVLHILEFGDLITKDSHNGRSLYSVTEKGYFVLQNYRRVRENLDF